MILLSPTLPADCVKRIFGTASSAPLARDEKITIAGDFTDCEDDEDVLAVLTEHVVSTEPMVLA